MAREVQIGQEVDGYRILSVLGRGGMGIVYKAERKSLQRIVALKMIDPNLSRNPVLKRRFRIEARSLARIDSPYIVRIHDLRESVFGLYFVMEYVDGKTLKEIFKKGPVPWQQAVPMIKQILRALKHAHNAGIIHRDIKPGNIMLAGDGSVKVMDFGIAKMARRRSDQTEADWVSTITQGFAGTLTYMSPEQARGARNVDARSDLFSLGMTFYEMLAGRLPFEMKEDEYSILKSIIEEKFPKLRRFNSSIPGSLARIVMKVLEKDPEKRYQSADEMLEALEAFEERVQAPATVTDAGAGRPKRRKKWIYALGSMALLLMVLVGLFALPPLLRSPPTLTIVPSNGTIEVDGGSKIEEVEGSEETPEKTTEVAATDEHVTEPRLAIPPTDEQSNDAIATGLSENLVQPSEETVAEVDRDTGARIGVLVIDSVPQGARILVDGAPHGVTPGTLQEAAVGSHTVVLRLEGYEVHTESIVVQAQQAHRMEARLLPLTGALQVRVNPGGQLFIDGRLDGEVTPTPRSITLPASSHRVRIVHPSYGTWEKEIAIAPNEEQNVTVDFNRIIRARVIALDTEGKPVRGTVLVDGESVGSTPRTIEVRMGVHRVEVRKEGYEMAGAIPLMNFEQDLTEALQIALRKIDE